MKLFNLLVVLMALIAAIEATPMDEEPMEDYAPMEGESMEDKAGSMEDESMNMVGKVHWKAKMLLA